VWNLCLDGNVHGIIYRHIGRTGLGWIDGQKSPVFRRGKSGNSRIQLIPLPLTVSCFSKIQIGFAFLVLAQPGSHGKRAIKRACVCVCVCVLSYQCLFSPAQSNWSYTTVNLSYLHCFDFTNLQCFSVTLPQKVSNLEIMSNVNR